MEMPVRKGRAVVMQSTSVHCTASHCTHLSYHPCNRPPAGIACMPLPPINQRPHPSIHLCGPTSTMWLVATSD